MSTRQGASRRVVSMPVSVMQVGVVRVLVAEGRMRMHVRVRLT